MTKEQYTLETARIESEIAKLKKEKEMTKGAYISANRRFADGEKVRVIIPYHSKKSETRVAYVSGYEVLGSSIKPILMKVKKDGSMSMQRYWQAFNAVVLPLDQSS